MSSTRSSVELEGGNEQYDELYEDWYTHTDDSSSSLPLIFATPPLAYMVIKRQTYPHWEKDALKDEVIVRVGGRHDEPDADSKSNISVDRTLTASRVRVTDSAALPTQSTEGEASNSNPNVRRAPSPAITSAHSSQLYAPSPNQSSLFASFAPPHFPPATQFPPLDPRAQKLLEKSSSEVRHQQREQGVIPTFSFSRLQTMVADSATRERSSVLSYLAGLHNQVQGSPQSPSLWRLPFEGEAEEKPDSLKSGRSVDDIGEVESTSVYTKASEDDSDALTDNRWPPKKDERFADIGHTFDDSFIPDCHSSTFSSSGIDEKSRRDASNSSIHSFGFASGSKRTCGHKKHYVRPLQGHDDADSGSENDDDGRDLSFFFRSESRHGSSSINRETPSDHDHIHTHHPREFTDTNVAMEDYAGSERSTRANANASNSSVFALVPDSRTSSEMYLSPNFLDSDHAHDYFGGGVVIYSAPDSDGGEGRENLDETIEDECDVSKNNHRVYFPTGDGQAKSSRTPFSTLRRLVTTTRRRVSNVGGAALGFGSVSRKQSQSQSQSTRPITQRSAPSAKEELEKSERPQKDTTAMSGNARKRNVLMKRGRSSTVRPLGFRHTTFRSRPLAVPKETKNQEPGHLETRRTSGRFSFIRRRSHLAGASNSSPKSAEQWATEAPKSSGKPEAATAPQLSLPTSQTQEEKRPRAQLDSGAAVLFRRFSLASPRTPGSFRGRRDTNPGDS